MFKDYVVIMFENVRILLHRICLLVHQHQHHHHCWCLHQGLSTDPTYKADKCILHFSTFGNLHIIVQQCIDMGDKCIQLFREHVAQQYQHISHLKADK